jgi:uncharacterized Tic20 family protein
MNLGKRTEAIKSKRLINLETLLIRAAVLTVLVNLVIIPIFSYQIDLIGVTSWSVLAFKTIGPVALMVFELLVVVVAITLFIDGSSRNENQTLQNNMQTFNG